MKKLLPYILTFVILANIFAPFSVAIDKNNGVDIKKNTVDAAGTSLYLQVTQTANTSTSITVDVIFEHYPIPSIAEIDVDRDKSGGGMSLTLKDSTGAVVQQLDSNSNFDIEQHPTASTLATNKDFTAYRTSYTFVGLKEGTQYQIYGEAFYDLVHHIQDYNDEHTKLTMKSANGLPYLTVFTLAKGANPNEQVFDKAVGEAGIDILPVCGIFSKEGSIAGCGVQLLYYMVFIPTSYMFGLAGKFFDATFGYSVQDSSYKTGFVTEGWGIVRDFCNIFFIFILIYAAFGMILGIHSIKTKEIVINTILIGLLINFSLFACQMMIDSSNILARVFYNSEAIRITIDKSGGTVTHGGVNLYDTTMGELPLSAAIVNKIEPQSLIINANRTRIADDTNTDSSIASKDTNIGVAGYFLVIFLAIIVNIVGSLVFLSIGIIFVSRVIGLWFAMIFAPFAFFSYTVPQMQGIAMIGWKKWWPDTLGMCFLAPLFMFFMYLILVFLEKGFVSLFEASNGPNFTLSIVIPFAFIMILLMTAKKLAQTYSGEMGKMVTGAVTSAGAMALGGAALSAAFIGRNTIGGLLKGSATGDTAAQRFHRGESRGTWDTVKGAIGKGLGGVIIQKGIGKVLNSGSKKVASAEHARHVLDDTAGKMFNGRKWNSLNDVERDSVRTRIDQTEAMRQLGTLTSTGKKITPTTTYGSLTDLEKDEVNNYVSTNKAQLDASSDGAQHVSKAAQQRTSAVHTMLQSSAFGTYDVRNLSKIIANEHDSAITKLGSGLISAISKGMGGGLKSQVGLNFGNSQGDFFKDLGHTIGEALKSTKINVDLSHVGEETHGEAKHGADAHGGGHH